MAKFMLLALGSVAGCSPQNIEMISTTELTLHDAFVQQIAEHDIDSVVVLPLGETAEGAHIATWSSCFVGTDPTAFVFNADSTTLNEDVFEALMGLQ